MNITKLKEICRLRLLIGYLGEKQQANWWGSSFLSKSSVTFLSPVFPKTTLVAQYNGVCQAAKRVHDEHIGLGRNYHLYRFPDTIERMLSKTIHDLDQEGSSFISEHYPDIEMAISQLRSFSGTTVDTAEGPVAVGDFSDRKVGSLLKTSVAYYLKAFENRLKCYPYMRNI